MGMWVAGSKFTNNFYNNEKYSPIPFSDFLKKSSSDMKLSNLFLIKLGNFSFICLLFIFIFISVTSSGIAIKKRKIDMIFFLQITCNIYLCLVSLINVSTIRYLMPIYSIIILLVINFINQKVLKN